MINKNDFDGNLVYGGKVFTKGTKRENIERKFPHYKFMDNIKGEYIPNKKYFQQLKNCPLCGSKKLKPLIVKDGLKIDQCDMCTFGFQNPRFKVEYIPVLYEHGYGLTDTYKAEIQKEIDEVKFRYALQEIYKYKNNIHSVLDIGSGNLVFLKVCQRSGIKKMYGIEPRSNVKVDKKNFTIITEFSDEIPNSIQNISLISMWDVLEHIHDFKKIVKSCYARLKDSGILLIMVPNLLSLSSRLIREKSPTFCIYHLNYFSERSLSQLLIENGFTVLQHETVISEIDNCRNYLEFQEPYMSIPRYEHSFDWLTPEYIHNNKLGGRWFFIAQK